MDEITRLRTLLGTIKANGGLKGIKGLDDELLDSINGDPGVFGDDALTISSRNSVRTRDLSIGERVNRQLDK